MWMQWMHSPTDQPSGTQCYGGCWAHACFTSRSSDPHVLSQGHARSMAHSLAQGISLAPAPAPPTMLLTTALFCSHARSKRVWWVTLMGLLKNVAGSAMLFWCPILIQALLVGGTQGLS